METDVETAEEEINDAQDSIGVSEGDLGEKHRAIVEQLKKNNGGWKNKQWHYV